MHRRNRAKTTLPLAVIGLAVAAAALAQTPKGGAAGKTGVTPAKTPAKTAANVSSQLPRPSPDSLVATVGPLWVARAEFEERYVRQRDQFSARSGSELATELVP